MLIIGEAINTSRTVQGERRLEAAVIRRDTACIAALACRQRDAGADYLDANAGTLPVGEPEALAWLTAVIQQAVDLPICFDSPNPAALAAALDVYDTRHGQPMINSITAESARYTQVLPCVLARRAKVIALAMDEHGIQADPARRLAVARTLVGKLMADGVPVHDIYLDPLTFPIGVNRQSAVLMLELIAQVKRDFPGVQTIAGVSNVSYGMPARKYLNQAMTVLALGQGLDAALVDPTDRHLMGLIVAAVALLGRDDNCTEYLAYARGGGFEKSEG
jgi:5-methyltetrahydrofolate--homocysteine methyltransferase